MKTFKPRDYQKKAISFLLDNPFSGLFFSPGLGKTSCVLFTFKKLKKIREINHLLVVMPLLVAKQRVWQKEIKKWGLKYKTTLLHGNKKSERINKKVDISLINYDGLAWLLQQSKRSNWRNTWLVFDESSKLKGTGTRRFKVVKKLAPSFKRRSILTGNPTPKSLLDLYGQIYTLDLGESLGSSFREYRSQYFYQAGYKGYDWRILPGAEEKIYKAISPLVLRLESSDDLPPLVRVPIFVTLPPAARKLYDQLESQFLLKFHDGKVTTANAGVLSGKLRQLTNGGLYYKDSNDVTQSKWIHDAKINALKELIDELQGSPAWVAYHHKHELVRLRQEFPQAVVMDKNDPSIVTRWNRGDIPILLGHPRSAAHGLNMQEAGKAVIFIALPFSYDDYDQFIRRLWRQGRKSRVMLYPIIAKDTLDQVILSAIRRKKRTQEDLFTAIEQYCRQKSAL